MVIPRLTVVELKGVIRDIGDVCRTRLALSGTKSQLINRLIDQLSSWVNSASWNNVSVMKRLVEEPRDGKGHVLDTTASASWAPWNGANGGVGSSYGHYSSLASGSQPYGGVGSNGAGYQKLASAGGGPSKYQPSGQRPSGHHTGYVGQGTNGVRSTSQAYVPSRLSFRPSPFWKIVQFLSSPYLISEAGAQVRKNAVIDVRLDDSTINLLKAPDSTHQVRLFCTPKAAADMSERNPQSPAQVEFPMSCEARINGTLYSSSLKGSKKTPGRVPPPNLNKDKTLITREGMVNKIELVYANAMQKYVMVVALCTITSVEAIVTKLTKEKRRSREEIIGSMKKAAAEDDIEISRSTLSLRDPLSYTRIQTPCRSLQCSHSQCFDASFFFMSNEQAPTWQCPHCSKILNPEELFIDGYFEDILRKVSEYEDAVDVDADGSWRTRDGKVFSSSGSVPTASSSQLGKAAAPSTPVRMAKQEEMQSPSLPSTPIEPPTNEIVLIDDDTPTPPPVSVPPSILLPHASQADSNTAKNVLSTLSSPLPMSISRGISIAASRSGSHNGPGTSFNDAIDLTLSDSEEETSCSIIPSSRSHTLNGCSQLQPIRRINDFDDLQIHSASVASSVAAGSPQSDAQQMALVARGSEMNVAGSSFAPAAAHSQRNTISSRHSAQPLQAAALGLIPQPTSTNTNVAHTAPSTETEDDYAHLQRANLSSRPFAAPLGDPCLRGRQSAPSASSLPRFSAYGGQVAALQHLQHQMTLGNRFKEFIQNSSAERPKAPICPLAGSLSPAAINTESSISTLYPTVPTPSAAEESHPQQVSYSATKRSLLQMEQDDGVQSAQHNQGASFIQEDEDGWNPAQRRQSRRGSEGKRQRRSDTGSTMNEGQEVSGAPEQNAPDAQATLVSQPTSNGGDSFAASTATPNSSGLLHPTMLTKSESRRRFVIRARPLQDSVPGSSPWSDRYQSTSSPGSSNTLEKIAGEANEEEEPVRRSGRSRHNTAIASDGDEGDEFEELDDSGESAGHVETMESTQPSGRMLISPSVLDEPFSLTTVLQSVDTDQMARR